MSNSMWESLAQGFKEFRNIPSRADAIAREKFPDSARDASKQNAFRHSLGTGMMTNKFGGGALGAAAAKLAGYGWEALGTMDNIRSPEQWADTKHDLNANAIGANAAIYTEGQQQLEQMLESLTNRSRIREPFGATELGNGQMTRSR